MRPLTIPTNLCCALSEIVAGRLVEEMKIESDEQQYLHFMERPVSDREMV